MLSPEASPVLEPATPTNLSESPAKKGKRLGGGAVASAWMIETPKGEKIVKKETSAGKEETGLVAAKAEAEIVARLNLFEDETYPTSGSLETKLVWAQSTNTAEKPRHFVAALGATEAADGSVTVFQEYVPLGLDEVLEKADDARRFEIAAELATAMRVAHLAGITFRDFDPAGHKEDRIRFSQDGQLRVVDFNISGDATKAEERREDEDHLRGHLCYILAGQIPRREGSLPLRESDLPYALRDWNVIGESAQWAIKYVYRQNPKKSASELAAFFKCAAAIGHASDFNTLLGIVRAADPTGENNALAHIARARAQQVFSGDFYVQQSMDAVVKDADEKVENQEYVPLARARGTLGTGNSKAARKEFKALAETTSNERMRSAALVFAEIAALVECVPPEEQLARETIYTRLPGFVFDMIDRKDLVKAREILSSIKQSEGNAHVSDSIPFKKLEGLFRAIAEDPYSKVENLIQEISNPSRRLSLEEAANQVVRAAQSSGEDASLLAQFEIRQRPLQGILEKLDLAMAQKYGGSEGVIDLFVEAKNVFVEAEFKELKNAALAELNKKLVTGEETALALKGRTQEGASGSTAAELQADYNIALARDQGLLEQCKNLARLSVDLPDDAIVAIERRMAVLNQLLEEDEKTKEIAKLREKIAQQEQELSGRERAVDSPEPASVPSDWLEVLPSVDNVGETRTFFRNCVAEMQGMSKGVPTSAQQQRAVEIVAKAWKVAENWPEDQEFPIPKLTKEQTVDFLRQEARRLLGGESAHKARERYIAELQDQIREDVATNRGLAERLARSQKNIRRLEGTKRPDEILEAEGQNVWLDAAGASDVGVVREENEDRMLVMGRTAREREQLKTRGMDGVCVVADGMGGHELGAEAAKTAIAAVQQNILEMNFHGRSALDFGRLSEAAKKVWLGALVERANGQVQAIPAGGSEKKAGTTLVMAVVTGNKATIAWVGDSRAYLVDGKGNIKQVTKDHKLVQGLIDLGQITKEEARNHPQRNVLSKALGSRHAEADIVTVDIPQGGSLLLCSDGVYGALSDQQIAQRVFTARTSANAAAELVVQANKEGGHDNSTAVVVRQKK